MRSRVMTMTAVFTIVMAVIALAQKQQGVPVAAVPLVRNWVKYSDPTEGAFTIDMPQGWKVSGRTDRLNALQYRSWAKAVSPDGMTILVINDPTEWSYVVPTPLLAASGFHEGSLYSGGGGTVYRVARYQTGEQFAVTWGQRRLSELCQAIKVMGHYPRLEIGRQINPYSQAFGIFHDVGEAHFTCEKNSIAMTADVLASVVSIRGSYGAIWYAETIQAFYAPTQVAGIAAGLLAHMIASTQINLNWLARNSENAVAVSRAATAENKAISDSIMRSWEARGAVIDRVMQEDSRRRLGIDIYTDSATGTRYTVANNHRYYWVDARGTVLGTDTDTPPGADFHRLSRVPPQ